jgi:hypothetical protein
MIPLSKQEFEILKLLVENPQRVFTKNNIYETVWGAEFLGDDNTINVHISRIRAKLARANSRPLRFLIAALVVAAWWGLGRTLQTNVAQYTLLGVPILFAFQWWIQRQPLLTLWVRSGPPLRMDAWFINNHFVLFVLSINFLENFVSAHSAGRFVPAYPAEVTTNNGC